MENYKVGEKFDEYILEKYIGSGTTAEVWRVADKEDKKFALKIIAPKTGLDDYSQDDLKKEYNKTKYLSHHNILIAQKYGEFSNRPFLVFELCGDSLAKELKQKVLHSKKIAPNTYYSEEDLADIIAQTASALSYIHSEEVNLVHLDVKPANILIRSSGEEDEKYVLSDFGITRELRKTVIKKSDDTGFSPAYAAPEQFTPNYEPQKESDLFALGVTIYELATGKLPSSVISIGQALKNRETIPELPGKYSSDFKELIKSCMAVNPKHRPSAEQLQSWSLLYLREHQWLKEGLQTSSRTAKKKLPVFSLKHLLFGLGGLGCILLTYSLIPQKANTENAAIAANYYEEGDFIAARVYYKKAIADGETGNNKEALQLIKDLEDNYYVIKNFIEERAAVLKEEGWGFIDKNGNELIPCQYESVSDFKSGYAAVAKDGLSGIIDKNGKIISPINKEGTIQIISASMAILNKEGKKEKVYILNRVSK